MKKLTRSFIITSIFSVGLYYIVNIYDKSGITINRINANIHYIAFLYISIILALTIYTNKDNKSKIILATIIFVNFLYIIFSFLITNIGLNNIQGIILVGLLLLAFISSYIKNRFGHTITVFSIIGIIGIVFFAIIPMYEVGPDIKGFKDQFPTQLIVQSKVNIKKTKANIKLDKKEISISNGLSSYKIKDNKSGSKILFIADKKYLNTFGYILFANKDLIQISPQSAINIQKINGIYHIEIITGTIKNYTNKFGNNKYIFTGNYKPSGEINKENISDIIRFYNIKQKIYIINQAGLDISKNKIINNISKYILIFLTKILPNQFSKNLDNFNEFQNYINTDINETKTTNFDSQKINKGILKDIYNSLKTTKIIK